jgi:hypothetical protein
MMGLVLLGLASCSILGVGAFLTFCVMFARQDDKVLQRKSCSCDNEWQEGDLLFDPEPSKVTWQKKKRYDWSHIKSGQTVKIEDCFE